MSNWTILCDFDGTISVRDTTDALLERFGRPGWEAVERAWREGEIGSRECMARQVALVEASPSELDAWLDEVAIDPAFPAFVAAAQAAGIPLTVLSDGLDHAIARILGRHGLGDLPVVANRLEAVGENGWRLEFPFGRTGCPSGNCKCGAAGDAHAARRRVLLIGDGASDFCVAGEADLVFAKGRLVEHCRTAAIPHLPIVDFRDALALLPMLVEGGIAAEGQVVALPGRTIAA
ncbi:MAG: MtnX-like HAD-IB family phosphatase [Xanthomonadales bacterium]|nr:MtnX-like HAD-IB family phosphatase [Xanthomonadales bacterium]